jgi:hypothetical protein
MPPGYAVEPPRYVTGPTPDAPPPAYSIGRSLRKLLILYVVVWATCLAMEGITRLKYGVGSVTEIEARISNRGQRAKALVARQKRIEAMNDDLGYEVYLSLVFFGTPIALVVVLIHDIRLVNRLMHRIWFPIRWLAIGFVAMMCGGVTIVLGPFIGAQHFYDRVSPAELIGRK